MTPKTVDHFLSQHYWVRQRLLGLAPANLAIDLAASLLPMTLVYLDAWVTW